MTDPTLNASDLRESARFVGSIPEFYDRYLGPVYMDPFARDLVRRLDPAPAGTVLELACGTGIATRRLRDRLPPATRLVATDLNEPMLEVARRKFRPEEQVEWKAADACALPFAAGSFSAVVCQFGLMFMPDKAAAIREARRVLAPGGILMLNVWDSLERNDLPRTGHETIGSLFPGHAPDFYQVPFSLHRPEALRGLLADAGFTDIRIETAALDGTSPSARDLAIGMVEGNPVANDIRQRGTVPIETVIDSVAAAVSARFGDRPVRARMQALVVSGRAPASPRS
jgi:SAM-dependent methyltransferase